MQSANGKNKILESLELLIFIICGTNDKISKGKIMYEISPIVR